MSINFVACRVRAWIETADVRTVLRAINKTKTFIEREKMQIVRETEYTQINVLDEPGAGNACHKYEVALAENRTVMMAEIGFQNGLIREKGVNGIQNEDLLAIVIHRLQGFQSGDFACRENAIALTKIQEALMWLEKRTTDRKARGVEGKNVK